MYEVFIGEVVKNNDPLKVGRLMLSFKDLINDVDPNSGKLIGVEFPEWVDPTFPFAGKNCGWFAVPPVGTFVECEVLRGEDGDDTIDTLDIKWRACLYNKEDPIPDEFQDNYPNTIGFKSIKGHIFMMDDQENSETIKLYNYKNEQYLELNPDGSIECKTKSGHILILDEKNDKVSLRYKDTDVITINSSGIFFGTESASEPMVLGDLWKASMEKIIDAILNHKHPTGVGPSGKMLPAEPEATELTAQKNDLDNIISDFIKGQKAKP